MPKFYVSKSLLIKAPVDKVYQNIRDLNNWTSWSPWLILDPDAKVSVTEDNRSYSWEGKRVGSGKMEISKEKSNEWVEMNLLFLTPFKSQAAIRFSIQSVEGGTNVIWNMDSSLPWFLFFMKKLMETFLGMDFQRGLFLLKDYSENGKIHSRLDFKGVGTYPGCTYLGIKNKCAIDDIASHMQVNFETLWKFLGEKYPEQVAAESFSIYHKWDLLKGTVTYTAAIPVKSLLRNLPDGMISGQQPPTAVYTLRHTGPYLHLGNAWSALNSMQRSKELKVNKKIHPFETYATLPGQVPDNELITEIHYPVK